MNYKYTNDISIMKWVMCFSLLGLGLSIYTENNVGIVLNGIGLYSSYKYFEELMYYIQQYESL